MFDTTRPAVSPLDPTDPNLWQQMMSSNHVAPPNYAQSLSATLGPQGRSRANYAAILRSLMQNTATSSPGSYRP